MKDLNYQLKQLCQRNRDGSFATQHQRERQLSLIASQLHKLGYRNLKCSNIKTKHVNALVQHWREKGLVTGTIKNRMSAIRWWAEKVNRVSVVPKDNAKLGIPDRQFVTNENRSASLSESQLANVKDEHVRVSLELQREFGLRREEAIKFQPSVADKGAEIRLQPTWTKGGKERCVPITTESQRVVLEKAKRLAGRGSLIPSNRSYVQQLRIYERHTARAGLSKLHGLRHMYAQQRYEELTGWRCPAAGGPTSKSLTVSQKALDFEVRLVISKELGHDREQVTAVYLGR